MVDPGGPRHHWRHHLRLERVHRLAGGAHHHQLEDHLQAGEPAGLSLGDDMQGWPELASCEGGAGKGGTEVGGGEKGEEVDFIVRVRFLPDHLSQNM